MTGCGLYSALQRCKSVQGVPGEARGERVGSLGAATGHHHSRTRVTERAASHVIVPAMLHYRLIMIIISHFLYNSNPGIHYILF